MQVISSKPEGCELRRANKIKRDKGFSLIELLIVVAIILILAAIAVPNFLRARIAANEASAASSVRKIATAEYSYNSTYPNQGYAPNLASLGTPPGVCAPSPASACILDNVLTTGVKSGYQFLATGFSLGGGINSSFVASAAPQNYNVTGMRNFCIVTDGVLRIDPGAAGTPPAPDVATCSAYPDRQ